MTLYGPDGKPLSLQARKTVVPKSSLDLSTRVVL